MASEGMELRDPDGLLPIPGVRELVEKHNKLLRQYREASQSILEEIKVKTGGEACGIDWEGVDGEAELRTVTVYRVKAQNDREAKKSAAQRPRPAGGRS